ncbi:MAG: hypothetical protein MZV64_11795 [Ignavibacteriales bacterium]|nr:hypothetical protein [Ignavibacteriales bacterium]
MSDYRDELLLMGPPLVRSGEADIHHSPTAGQHAGRSLVGARRLCYSRGASVARPPGRPRRYAAPDRPERSRP